MITSAAGRLAIMRREGVCLSAYQDERGIWTIGVGHTASAGAPAPYKGLVITNVQCDEILGRDLSVYEEAVNIALDFPVSQNAYDACISLCYNIGVNGFAGSTVVHKINLRDMA